MTNEELAVRIQAGEQNLMGELWEQNIGLFYLKANSLYTRLRERCDASGVEFDDLLQTCYFALCDAVQAYKADGEYNVMSYIKFPLKNHFRSLLGIRTSKRDALNESNSLDEPIGDDGDTTRLEMLTDPNSGEPYEAVVDNVFQSELRDTLEKSISKLSERRAAVVHSRYFEGKTFEEVAVEMNVSGQMIQHLERESFYKMRRDRDLQVFHDEVLSRWAYKGTGFRAFKENGISSVERAVIEAEEVTEGRRENMDEREAMREINRAVHIQPKRYRI